MSKPITCARCGFSFGIIEPCKQYEGCDSTGAIFFSTVPMHVNPTASDDDDDEGDSPCMIAVRERIDTLTAERDRLAALAAALGEEG